MDIFSHTSVFISIILGLAVVHILGGISLILDARVKTKVYWLHLLWTFNMLIVIVLVWMSSIVLSPLEEISVAHFFNYLAYAIVTNLMCGLLYPIRGEEVTNFRIHFWDNRKKFYLLGIIFVIIDAIDGAFEHFNAKIPWDTGQYGTLAAWLIFFILGLRFSGEKFNILIAFIFLIGTIGWLASLVEMGVLSW